MAKINCVVQLIWNDEIKPSNWVSALAFLVLSSYFLLPKSKKG
jgi:hypothetical protein